MTRFAAFLRGLNVGRGHRVTMPLLCARFEAVGCTDVSSYQAAGNLLFSANRRAGTIESLVEDDLAAALGYAVPTFVRTGPELAAVIDHDPFAAVGGTTQVGFLKRPLDASMAAALEALSGDYDTLHVHGRELWWHTNGGISGSTIGPTVDKALGKTLLTMRNVTTLGRLLPKLLA